MKLSIARAVVTLVLTAWIVQPVVSFAVHPQSGAPSREAIKEREAGKNDKKEPPQPKK